MYNTYVYIYIYAHGGTSYDDLSALNHHLPLDMFRAFLYWKTSSWSSAHHILSLVALLVGRRWFLLVASVWNVRNFLHVLHMSCSFGFPTTEDYITSCPFTSGFKTSRISHLERGKITRLAGYAPIGLIVRLIDSCLLNHCQLLWTNDIKWLSITIDPLMVYH